MIINPHRDTRPCAPNCLCAFQRWLQRPLSPVEASIIEPLERLRSKNAASGSPTRIYIDTTDQTAPTARDILILYIRWISAVISPGFNSCIVVIEKPPSTIEGASERFVCKADVVKAEGSIQSYVTEALAATNAADGPLSRVLEKAIFHRQPHDPPPKHLRPSPPPIHPSPFPGLPRPHPRPRIAFRIPRITRSDGFSRQLTPCLSICCNRYD